jgi:predicted anti-sigma-YlaC factor YlaD
VNEGIASLSKLIWLVALMVVGVSGPGCSIKRMAVNRVGDALAAGGSTFASDNDPELVKAAVPFSLKLMESLLAESPKHPGLLFATASGFTQYAYAFVQLEADQVEEQDFAAAQAMRERARRLYLRGRDYGLRGIEARHPRFETRLRRDSRAALRMIRRKDVPMLYWTAASWGAAIAVLKDKPDLIADVALVEAMMDRALELWPDYDHGAIHTFLISYEVSRQESGADWETRARRHFARAMALSEGQQAGPLVSMAESVALQQQDVVEFRALLERALAIDPDARPEWRLVNLLMQDRARWLLSKTDELFLLTDDE